MKNDKPLIDLTEQYAPTIHLHVHASSLQDLTFCRGVVDLLRGVNSDDAEFVRALTHPDDGILRDLPPQGGVQ